MSDKKVQKLVVSALMAALTYVATMVVQIPSPMNGYVNLGDCFVLLSGWLLGPWYGGAAAGIGSMLTDLLSGYGYYAPGTFVIKGLDALVAALIFKAMGRTSAAAIVSGQHKDQLAEDTRRDHALLMDFFRKRDADGAAHAMAIHMHHSIDVMGLEE